MVMSNANRKQDGPPLPSPLLPQWEEREDNSLLSSIPFPSSKAVGLGRRESLRTLSQHHVGRKETPLPGPLPAPSSRGEGIAARNPTPWSGEYRGCLEWARRLQQKPGNHVTMQPIWHA